MTAGMVGRYEYSDAVRDEVEHMVRLAIPAPVRLTAATRPEDFGGVDLHYALTANCDLQIRCRFDRPPTAPDDDVTFRTTEPAMIEAGTYAPLMLFVWFRNGRAVAGKLVDVYGMAVRLDPPLADRDPMPDPRGENAGFVVVTIAELVDAKALLRQGDARSWAPAVLGGDVRTRRILDRG